MRCCWVVDRGWQPIEGEEVRKHQLPVNMLEPMEVPTFIDRNPDSTAETHVVVCAVAHLGVTPNSGHYRAMLRLDLDPPAWALCEDNQEAQYMDTIPAWFAQQVTLIWTSRRDRLRWPMVPMPP